MFFILSGVEGVFNQGSVSVVSSSSPLTAAFTFTVVFTSWRTVLTRLSRLSALSGLSVIAGLSPFSSLFPVSTSAVLTVATLSALTPLFLSLFPGLLGKEVALDVERGMVSGVLALFSSGFTSEGDLDYGQKPFLSDCEKSLLLGLIHINNLSFSDVDDLVKTFNLSAHDLTDPECPVHDTLSRLDGHKTLAFTEEESKSPGDILAWVDRDVP